MNPVARAARAGLAYFAVVFAAGFAFGVVRQLWAVPRFGETVSELAEMPLMLTVSAVAALWLSRRAHLSTRLLPRLTMGFIALTCLITAEIGVLLLVRGQSLVEYATARDALAGAAYIVSLFLFALMPWLLRGHTTSETSAGEM